MKLIPTTAALCLAALTLTSCASRLTLTADELAGEWAVARLDGKAVDPGKDVPYLGFDSTRVYGFTGCNRLMGSLPGEKMKRGEVDFGRVATTMMACPDNRYEQAFMNALRQTERMALVDGQLVMIGADRREVMALERRPFQVMSPDGTWDVTELRGEPVTPGEGTPYLTFDLNRFRISGFTGCNRITGSLRPGEVEGGKPDFSKLGTTRMACPDDQYEERFMSALRATASLMTNGPTMLLKDAGGQTLVKLKKRQ